MCAPCCRPPSVGTGCHHGAILSSSSPSVCLHRHTRGHVGAGWATAAHSSGSRAIASQEKHRRAARVHISTPPALQCQPGSTEAMAEWEKWGWGAPCTSLPSSSAHVCLEDGLTSPQQHRASIHSSPNPAHLSPCRPSPPLPHLCKSTCTTVGLGILFLSGNQNQKQLRSRLVALNHRRGLRVSPRLTSAFHTQGQQTPHSLVSSCVRAARTPRVGTGRTAGPQQPPPAHRLPRTHAVPWCRARGQEKQMVCTGHQVA